MNPDQLFDVLFVGRKDQALWLKIAAQNLSEVLRLTKGHLHSSQMLHWRNLVKLMSAGMPFTENVPVLLVNSEEMREQLTNVIEQLSPLVEIAAWTSEKSRWKTILTLKPDSRIIAHYAALKIGADTRDGQDKLNTDSRLGVGFAGNQSYEIDLAKCDDPEAFWHRSARRHFVSLKLEQAKGA